MSLREGYGLGTGTIWGPLSQIHLNDTSSHLGGISGPNSTAIMTIMLAGMWGYVWELPKQIGPTNGLEWWAHWGHPSKRDLAGASKALDVEICTAKLAAATQIRGSVVRWPTENYIGSYLSSKPMHVFLLLLTLLLLRLTFNKS